MAGQRERFSSQYAAFINGTYAHSLAFDDIHRHGYINPGCVVIPTALALGESTGVDGKTFIAAIVAGYDVSCLISEALIPKTHFDRGFHPTATAGVFGGTAAGAVILNFDSVSLHNAFGINGSQAAGSLQFLENGAWNMGFNAGFSAYNAVASLIMAQNGVLGASNPLEGRAGFLHSYSDHARPEIVMQKLRKEYQILNTALKPYPCSRFIHTPIDLIISIVTNENIWSEDIEEIIIGLPSKSIDMVAFPQDKKKNPVNVVDSQFSIYLTVAVAAAYRRFICEDFTRINEPVIKKLIEQITVVYDDAAETLYPEKLAARVIIKVRGKTYEKFDAIAKGEPEKPLSWSEITAKFNDLMPKNCSKQLKSKIVSKIRNLEDIKNVKELASLLVQC